MQTGTESPIVLPQETRLYSQNSMSSETVYDLVLNVCFSPVLITSNWIGTVEYDDGVQTKIEFSFFQACKSKTN